MEIPKIGSNIEIISLKHNRNLHRCWKDNIVLHSNENIVIGANDQTIVEESKGKQWRTTEPGIFYFDRRFWFNIIVVMREEDYYYYCNLSSPFTYKNKKIQYIDYDIDIVVQPDYSYEIVDQEEYEENKKKLDYPSSVHLSIQKDLAVLENWINKNVDPFNKSFINHWYRVFLNNKEK